MSKANIFVFYTISRERLRNLQNFCIAFRKFFSHFTQ